MSETWCEHREYLSNALHLKIKIDFVCPWCVDKKEETRPKQESFRDQLREKFNEYYRKNSHHSASKYADLALEEFERKIEQVKNNLENYEIALGATNFCDELLKALQ